MCLLLLVNLLVIAKPISIYLVMSRSATRRWLKKKNCGQVADEFAEGQIVLSLEGGYNCEVTAECGVECVKVCAWVGGCLCVSVCVCV